MSLLLAVFFAVAQAGPAASPGTVSAPASAATPAAPAAPAAPAEKVEQVEILERLGQPVPTDAIFFDAFMNQVTLKDVFSRGKPVLLSLVYFDCPMLCSLVMSGLIKGLNESGLQLGKDYVAVTASFNPKDTPRDASHYMQGYLQTLRGADKARAPDWMFLTGGQSSISGLSEAVGYKYRFDREANQFEHPAAAFVLTPDGRMARYFYGIEFPARELRLALVEASQGRVGTSLDRVLLKCFKYDPASRRYRIQVLTVLRIGASAVAIALFSTLAVLWRREVKRGTVS